MMLDWYFSKKQEDVWLGTTPKSRAEIFYKKAGWKEVGKHRKGEIKFEMTYQNWQNSKLANQVEL